MQQLHSFQPDRSRHAQQRGIALVVVLWVLALLSVMALGVTTAQRSLGALTLNQRTDAEFRALADAAIQLAVLNLSTQPSALTVDTLDLTAVWLPDGSPHQVTIADTTLEVIITDEAARLDLNQITREQLAVLLEVAGADPKHIDALADAVIDWRDPDDLTQLNGAEDGDYQAAGRDYGARDAPFESVEELGQVLGMTPELVARLIPDLRVASAAGESHANKPVFGGHNSAAGQNITFNPRFASAAVIAATQNVSYDQAVSTITQRMATEMSTGVPDRSGPHYRVRVQLATSDVVQRVLEVALMIRPTDTPPLVIWWRREALSADHPVAPIIE